MPLYQTIFSCSVGLITENTQSSFQDHCFQTAQDLTKGVVKEPSAAAVLHISACDSLL